MTIVLKIREEFCGVGDRAILFKKQLHFLNNYGNILLMENKCICWANILAGNASVGGMIWLISIML